MVDINTITIKPEWAGQVAVCIAGGASLTPYQVNAVKGLKTIVVNDGYKIAPWADILYACDPRWWHWQKDLQEFKDFKGYKLQHFCHNKLGKVADMMAYDDFEKMRATGAPYPGIDCIISSGEAGFDPSPDRIKHGGNSGYQALHVALHLGAKAIILLGYDMHAKLKTSHWFGEHPYPFNRYNTQLYEVWQQEFFALENAANERGQKIINCSPGSRLDCFEKADLIETLRGLHVTGY